MKQLFFFIILFIDVYVSSAQQITLNGAVNVPQAGSRITLSRPGIVLNKVTLICNKLVINNNVASITIIGDVKITCKNLVNNGPNTLQILAASAKGSLTIEKPLHSPEILIENVSSQLIEMKWKPTVDD